MRGGYSRCTWSRYLGFAVSLNELLKNPRHNHFDLEVIEVHRFLKSDFLFQRVSKISHPKFPFVQILKPQKSTDLFFAFRCTLTIGGFLLYFLIMSYFFCRFPPSSVVLTLPLSPCCISCCLVGFY